MSFASDFRAVVQHRDFRKLYFTRLAGQASDGMFQMALASYVFFAPERQADAGAAAAALATLLLPYTFVGPFAGVFLDRWRRRHVLVRANVVRAFLVAIVAGLAWSGVTGVALFCTALIAVSINRFYLTALGASLPHVVRRDELIMANSVSATSGTMASLAGGGLGLALHQTMSGGRGTDAAHMLAAVCGYLCSALLAIGAHRFCYGISTIATLLLYRNYFNDPADTEAGLAGLGRIFAASGAGFLAAAVVTPPAAARLGKPRWITVCTAACAVLGFALAAPYDEPPLGADAEQERGRVFSFYDMLFNVSFVSAATVAALTVPGDGKSYPVLAAISVGYALTATVYWRATRRRAVAAAPAQAVRPAEAREPA